MVIQPYDQLKWVYEEEEWKKEVVVWEKWPQELEGEDGRMPGNGTASIFVESVSCCKWDRDNENWIQYSAAADDLLVGSWW